MYSIFICLLALFTCVATVVTCYLVVLTIGAYFFRKRVRYTREALRLAVIIPAFNEEAGIGKTIAHIHASNYPGTHRSVFVIADNCTDNTAHEARRRGARVFERTDTVHRGKGQALDWFFKNYKEEYGSFHGVIIIDADTRIDRNFLSEIGASLKHPDVKVVQGYNGVGNPKDHWRSGLLCAAFHVFNHLRPAGSNAFGGTAGLRGNGMAFRSEILAETGWPAHSLIEDYEFSLQLLLKDIFVHYNPDAMVFSDMPTHGKPVETQRMRWERWYVGMKARYALLVLRHVLKQPSLRYFNVLLGLFVPPLSLLVLTQAAILGIGVTFNPHLVALMVVCLALDLFYVVSGLIQRKAAPVVWLSLLSAPVYVLWKIPLYMKMMTVGHSGWVRTKRTGEL